MWQGMYMLVRYEIDDQITQSELFLAMGSFQICWLVIMTEQGLDHIGLI